jgi:hypothetical protein
MFRTLKVIILFIIVSCQDKMPPVKTSTGADTVYRGFYIDRALNDDIKILRNTSKTTLDENTTYVAESIAISKFNDVPVNLYLSGTSCNWPSTETTFTSVQFYNYNSSGMSYGVVVFKIKTDKTVEMYTTTLGRSKTDLTGYKLSVGTLIGSYTTSACELGRWSLEDINIPDDKLEFYYNADFVLALTHTGDYLEYENVISKVSDGTIFLGVIENDKPQNITSKVQDGSYYTFFGSSYEFGSDVPSKIQGDWITSSNGYNNYYLTDRMLFVNLDTSYTGPDFYVIDENLGVTQSIFGAYFILKKQLTDKEFTLMFRGFTMTDGGSSSYVMKPIVIDQDTSAFGNQPNFPIYSID